MRSARPPRIDAAKSGDTRRVEGWHANAPELELLGMAFTMMFLPSFLAIALLWSGLVEDADTLLLIQHVVMLPSMLIAMLLRCSEYAGHAHS